MKLLAPFYKPLLFALLIFFGIRRLIRPERVLQLKLAEAAKKTKTSAERPEILEEKPAPEFSRAKVSRIRWVGAVWISIGVLGFWLNPLHFGLATMPAASALARGDFHEVEADVNDFMRKHSIVNMSVAVISGDKEASTAWQRRQTGHSLA